MGSGSSKDATEEGPSSSSNGCSSRSIGRRCFGSACLGLPKVLSADDKDEQNIGGLKKKAFIPCDEDQPDSEQPKFADTPSANNSYRMSDGNQEIISHPISTVDRNSITQNSTTMNPPTRLHSRFGFFPDGISFRFGRATSLGSSSVLSRNYPIPCTEQHHGINRNDSTDRTSADQETVVDAISAQDASMNNLATNLETRWPQRRLHESAEGTARFSRTRSVGRLRDRVLRRTSLLEGRLGSLLPDEEGSLGRRYLNSMTNISSDTDDEVVPTSSNPLHSISRNISSIYNNEPVGSPLMEPGFQETLENSSAFLERRRRIRSQVRALQRLGSRFENVSGHDRSCILSGQHRTGRCACRTGNRSVNPDDDNTGTRASISRIVMLAEALFEVLDEIHQQAIVLASRPSLSSIGSVPAPKEVVDCMPVKTYKKLQKQESDDDATQCYICLVEYEDGDSMRILPCHHEFHQACVDKWLKEIHRVCPLCRGDVCISDSSQVDG